MLLIDAVYINNGGGLVLLKYLVEQLESCTDQVFYVFDERTREFFSYIDIKRKIFINNSMYSRYCFYKEYGSQFEKVLCFGNIPPLIRLKSKVYVYFHQPLFLSIPQDFSPKNKIVYRMKQFILHHLKYNADIWLVQSSFIQKQFVKKYYSGKLNNVELLPFYPELSFSEKSIHREKNTFLYVSNSSAHKNHFRLIEAFCLLYDEFQEGLLTLTIPQYDVRLCHIINEKNQLGYPIKNIGFIDRSKLVKLYLSHEYLIFPSLAESFGLGLVEAIDGGCKIIAADLPYTYEVCQPSLVFDPLIISSIKDAMTKAMTTELPMTHKVISNDISKLISLLME